MTCSSCGRADGHHIGCPEIRRVGLEIEERSDEVPQGESDAPEPCAYPGCANPRYSTHPRAKYCEDHRDPKNRKE